MGSAQVTGAFRQRPSIPLLLALIAAGGCVHSDDEQQVRVPSNATYSLGYAIPRLLDAGLKISIPSFPPQPAGVGLEGYGVTLQTPRAPALVERGSVVTLRLRSSLIPSAAFRTRHPPTIVVPDLIGRPYPDAVSRVPEGLWIWLRAVPPLRPDDSSRGLRAFVVAAQQPRPGTRMPYGCSRVAGGGCRVSLVRLWLESAD